MMNRFHFTLMTLVAVYATSGCSPAPNATVPKQDESSAGPATAAVVTPDVPAPVFDMKGSVVDPFAGPPGVRVFVFVTTDCPIANRYAPKLQRMSQELTARGVMFYLVYPVKSDTAEKVESHRREYDHTSLALLDPNHTLVERSGATVTPEAAVFNTDNKLMYCGRIDDWYTDFGKNRREPTTHELRDAIEAVLIGQPVKAARMKAIGCYIPE